VGTPVRDKFHAVPFGRVLLINDVEAGERLAP
jgi:hypothetical protein